MKTVKPLSKSPCCNYSVRFRTGVDAFGDDVVCCVCKKCGKYGSWFNVPFCDSVFWLNSAYDFASLYWTSDRFGNALKNHVL